MDSSAFAQLQARLGINEGCRATRYFDSEGIPTIGIGFNLTRDDAAEALGKCGVVNVAAVMAGTSPMIPPQINALFAYSIAPIVSEARASLQPGVFDFLTDPRQVAICDMVFNLGAAGWGDFTTTRGLINQGQMLKDQGRLVQAHGLFVEAAQHILASPYASQVGDRAKRNAAMIQTGEYCDPNGDGSDLV